MTNVQEAAVLSFLGACKRFRGQHSCENDHLLNKVLNKGSVAEKGDVKNLAAPSSQDIALRGNYRLAETVFQRN